MYDTVNVNLPYTVTVGEKTLQPGEYKIQQLQDLGGGSRILLIYSDSGMKFETNAMTIPALENKTPDDTKVMLHHFGNDYYFDKIWIQGKDYGYEFPLPKGLKEREKERQEAATVKATYVANPTTTAKAEDATPPPAATAPAQEPPPQATPPAETAQTAPPPEIPPPAAEQPAPPPPATPNNEANREMSEQEPATPPMPATSAGWLTMLLGGSTLSGAGMLLRRKR